MPKASRPRAVDAPSSEENRVFVDGWNDHRARLLAAARSILGSASDAEDAVQDALCAAWRCRAGFRGASSPATWLHRIAVNAALMELRRRRRRPAESLEALSAARAGHEPCADAPSALERVLAAERAHALQCALATLPGADLAAVLADDATDVCGGAGDGSRAAWKSRRFRARRHLREVVQFSGAAP
jgi:RNA polymerase sigma-70 factor (ECF subfamily)